MKSLIASLDLRKQRMGKLCLSTVLLCRSLMYVEDDDENDETRPSHLI